MLHAMWYASCQRRRSFDSKRVGGTAELTVLAAPGAQEIVLDSNGLEIEQVTDGAGRALAYTMGEPDPRGGKGAPLTITLDGAETLRIAYRAPEDASALRIAQHVCTKGSAHGCWLIFGCGQG